MDNEENKQPILTDEEVWLRAYCAAMPYRNNNPERCSDDADTALCFFHATFKHD